MRERWLLRAKFYLLRSSRSDHFLPWPQSGSLKERWAADPSVYFSALTRVEVPIFGTDQHATRINQLCFVLRFRVRARVTRTRPSDLNTIRSAVDAELFSSHIDMAESRR